jgi:hypothetical protein
MYVLHFLKDLLDPGAIAPEDRIIRFHPAKVTVGCPVLFNILCCQRYYYVVGAFTAVELIYYIPEYGTVQIIVMDRDYN